MASNLYVNAITGATPNPPMPDPDAALAQAANAAIENAVEPARELIGAHQAAAAVIVEGDWSSARKYFLLSEKYAAWARYDAPAKGFGSHAWFLRQTAPVRMTWRSSRPIRRGAASAPRPAGIRRCTAGSRSRSSIATASAGASSALRPRRGRVQGARRGQSR